MTTALDVAGELDAALTRLTTRQIPAALNRQDLNEPGVLLSAPSIAWGFGGQVTYRHRALVIAPNVGPAAAYGLLGPLIARVAEVLPITGAEPLDAAGIDGADPAPAYRITWETTRRPSTHRTKGATQ